MKIKVEHNELTNLNYKNTLGTSRSPSFPTSTERSRQRRRSSREAESEESFDGLDRRPHPRHHPLRLPQQLRQHRDVRQSQIVIQCQISII